MHIYISSDSTTRFFFLFVWQVGKSGLVTRVIFFYLFLFFLYFCRECKDGAKRKKTDLGFRVAFKTKSDLEIMDDGFKWRKYGKKSVKNSPNPR